MNKKRGGISSILVVMIGLGLFSYFMYTYMKIDITSIKYENMSQYARDTLLVLETTGNIEKNYLLDVKRKLSDKLDMQTGERLNIYIKIGDGQEMNISNSSTPATLHTDYGDDISLRFTYEYNVRSISFNKKLLSPNVSNSMQTMEIQLNTKSISRRVNNG